MFKTLQTRLRTQQISSTKLLSDIHSIESALHAADGRIGISPLSGDAMGGADDVVLQTSLHQTQARMSGSKQYSLMDVLHNRGREDGEIRSDMETLLFAFDRCLYHISLHWDNADALKNKNGENVQFLLEQQCQKEYNELVAGTVTDVRILHAKLLTTAQKMCTISIVQNMQKMIYIPELVEDVERTIKQLSGIEQTVVRPKELNILHSEDEDDDDDKEEEEEEKEAEPVHAQAMNVQNASNSDNDDDEDEEDANAPSLSSMIVLRQKSVMEVIDQNESMRNSLSERAKELVFQRHKLYCRTTHYRQNKHRYKKSHGASLSFSTFRTRQFSNSSASSSNISTPTQTQTQTHAPTKARARARAQPQTHAVIPMKSTFNIQSGGGGVAGASVSASAASPPPSAAASILSSIKRVFQYQTTNPNGFRRFISEQSDNNEEEEDDDDDDDTYTQKKIIDCEGCNNQIKLAECFHSCIIYKVKAYPKKRFYFHDEQCVTLRRMKESIRKYVLQAFLEESMRSKTTEGYIHHLLSHYRSLITTSSKGENHPRPKNINLIPQTHANRTYSRDDVEIYYQRQHTLELMKWQKRIRNRKPQGLNDAYEWKFDGLPNILLWSNMSIYGESLWEYLVYQLQTKQLNALWLALAYVSGEITAVKSLDLLVTHQTEICKVKDMENLDLLCSTMIESSNYTIAMCLYLSTFMKQNGDRDVSREEEFYAMSDKYNEIANQLVSNMESDHLLSLRLETPTDINFESVWDIAFKHNITDFTDNSRIQLLGTHMWTTFDYLNPNQAFRTKELKLFEMIKFLMFSPASFYYCPVGRYWIQSLVYMFYVCVVSATALNRNYDLNSRWDFANNSDTVEFLTWIFTFGYVVHEFTEMAFTGWPYLTASGNSFDMLIMVNWAILFYLRWFCNTGFSEQQCSTTDTKVHSTPVLWYMAIFALQLIILWSRVALIFVRNTTLGPFIAMIPGMLSDIVNWIFVLGIFYVGFTLAIWFIVNGDINENCNEDGANLSDLGAVGEYMFYLLMGQSDWEVLNTDPNCGITQARSLLLKTFCVLFALMGTTLLLNLLIAMMASTYELKREGTTKEVNFARSELTYELSKRHAIIPAPLNVLAYAFGFVWFIFDFSVYILSMCFYATDVHVLLPVRVSYKKDENVKRSCAEVIQRCCARGRGLIVAVPDNEIWNPCTGSCRWQRDDDDDEMAATALANKRTPRTPRATDVARVSRVNRGDGHCVFNTGRIYCRFCRTKMEMGKSGDISDYFKEFRNYRLDKADVDFMKNLLEPVGICKECYRPFIDHPSNAKNGRLTRFQVVLEVVSFYVFMVFCYVPMIILLCLPAAWNGIVTFLDFKVNQTSIDDTFGKRKTQFEDDRYLLFLEEAIESENNTETEQLSEYMTTLNTRLVNIREENTNSNLVMTGMKTTMDESFERVTRTLLPAVEGVQSSLELQSNAMTNYHQKQISEMSANFRAAGLKIDESRVVLDAQSTTNVRQQTQLSEHILMVKQQQQELHRVREELKAMRELHTREQIIKSQEQAQEHEHLAQFESDLKNMIAVTERQMMDAQENNAQTQSQLAAKQAETLQVLKQELEEQKVLRTIKEDELHKQREIRLLLDTQQRSEMTVLNSKLSQIELEARANADSQTAQIEFGKRQEQKLGDMYAELERYQRFHSPTTVQAKRMEQIHESIREAEQSKSERDSEVVQRSTSIELKKMQLQQKREDLEENLLDLKRQHTSNFEGLSELSFTFEESGNAFNDAIKEMHNAFRDIQSNLGDEHTHTHSQRRVTSSLSTRRQILVPVDDMDEDAEEEKEDTTTENANANANANVNADVDEGDISSDDDFGNGNTITT